MKAHLQHDGSLLLDSAGETRIVRPEHARYAALMALFHRHASVALSAHAPKGYTKEKPLKIGEHSYIGGQFIPTEVVNEATPEEKAKLDEPGPEAEPEHVPEPGYGGHPWKGGTPEEGKVYNAPMADLYADPDRFQYKTQGVNKKGVTDQFKDVAFDPRYAGVLSVWKDPEDGKTYIVNGHHRYELAHRSGNVESMAVRYLTKAKTASEARAAGALINIADGKGTALDAATFMRDSGKTLDDFRRENINVKDKMAQDASALTSLNDRLFGLTSRGQIDESQAIAIGKHLTDHSLQDQLATFLAKKADDGKEYAPKVVEDMAREMAETPTHTTTENTLFGDIESEESLFGERNELKVAVRNDLAKAVNDFKAVSSERRAGAVGHVGNVLNVEENRKIAEENARSLTLFDKLVNRKGPISDVLNQGAIDYAKATGKKAKDAARASTIQQVRAAIQAELAGAERRAVPSAGAGGSGARPGGEGKLPVPTADAERDQTQPDGLKPQWDQEKWKADVAKLQHDLANTRSSFVSSQVDKYLTSGKDGRLDAIKSLTKHLDMHGSAHTVEASLQNISEGKEPRSYDLPEGWSIRPVGKQLGLFREGRKTPVAKAKSAEELKSKITIPKPKKEGAKPRAAKKNPEKRTELSTASDISLREQAVADLRDMFPGYESSTAAAEYAQQWNESCLTPDMLGDQLDDVDAELANEGQILNWDGEQWDVSDEPIMALAVRKAPKGGITLMGKRYKGGQFIPAEVIAQAKAAGQLDKAGKPVKAPSTEASEAEGPVSKQKSATGDEKPRKMPSEKLAPTPTVFYDDSEDQLAGTGKGSRGGRRLHPGKRVGGDADSPPAEVLSGTGEGAGERPGGVRPDADVRGDEALQPAGGSGDADGSSGGVGAGATAADYARGAGRDKPRRSGRRTGGRSGGDPAGDGEQSLRAEPTPENPTDLSGGNFRYSDELRRAITSGGQKVKYQQNIDAIQTLRAIEAEGRTSATPAEQAIMSKYVGWGQFPGIFREHGEAGFDYHEQFKWRNEAQALRSLLTEDEWDKARASTLNAHYTHPDVVDTHWQIAQRLGFKGGRFLETSAGIGYYLGMMPPDLASATSSAAVELDTVTASMLKLLYPAAKVHNKGFEKHVTPDNFYDLVASNVPFGDYHVHDDRYNKHRALIHDYFFLKSVDIAKPGGLIMHVTSTGTMDKGDSKIREELAKQCDLVAAIRFPGNTHKENAGTEVVTDLLILRKRTPGEEGSGPKWMSVKNVPDPDGKEPIAVNEYFADHPEQILGRLDRSGTMYRADAKNVSATDDYKERLAAAIERLPRSILTSNQVHSHAFEPQAEAPDGIRPGNYVVKKGKLYQSENGGLVERPIRSKDLARVEGQIAIRTAVRALIDDQVYGRNPDESRAELNKVYDAFVRQHGFLNQHANKNAFRGDPDSPVLLALEHWDADKKTATKADMFSKDTIRPRTEATSAANVSEAIGISLHDRGRLDVDHMAQLLSQDKASVEKDLRASGIAFEDPGEGWKPANQYLSGNVRRKLVMARAAAEVDPRFKPNVEALEKVQPEDIDHHDIDVKLGASWVPPSDIAHFAAHVLGASPGDFDIAYSGATGDWTAGYSRSGEDNLKYSQSATRVWAVRDGSGMLKADFMDLLKAGLANRSITIKQAVPSEDGERVKEVVDPETTDAARAKMQELKDAFKDWIWQDDARRQRLHRHYNDNFNNIRDMKYDGSHLTFPGMNPPIELRPQQRDFVWQVVTTGKGLAAHEVGTGKTYTMIAAAMELRRLGLAKKPAIACLKTNVETIAHDARNLYPGAKILSTADVFDAKSRKKTISQIATGDYDMVIMTHDNLNMLKMRPETVAGYIKEELADLEAAMEARAMELGNKKKNDRAMKQLEKRKKDLEAKLLMAMKDSKKDDAVHFEDLGIDTLFVDEAHLYKSLPVYTKMDRVKGVPANRSDRATTMLMRTRWLQEQNGGRGVIFATGTPIANTMAELYTMQRYLQPDQLKERGIHHFDAWANLFGDVVTQGEFTVTGEYKPVSRFAKFTNIPELMQIARQVFDVQRADDIKNKDGSQAIVRPKRKDRIMTAPNTPAVKALAKSLQARAEKVKGLKPWETTDNMLKICTDGRKGSVDMRLVDPNAGDDPQSKANLCIKNVLDLSKERPGLTQLIFCDVGVNPMKYDQEAAIDDEAASEDVVRTTPAADEDASSLRFYQDVIDKLVKGGIPRAKIADFSKLSGEAKESAMEAMRRGEVLVAIGSTKKLGTGVNVQNKVTAMHHIDVPWVPADIEQRLGRGWRPGNENPEVENYMYVTEGSADQLFWQIVSTKAAFIRQVMSPAGANSVRSVSNDDTESLSFEQLMAAASGDGRVLEKIDLERELKSLKSHQARHDREQGEMRNAEIRARSFIEDDKKKISRIESDVKHLNDNPDFAIRIGDTNYTDRKEAEEAFGVEWQAAEKRIPTFNQHDHEEKIGNYRGFDVIRRGPAGGGHFLLVGPSGLRYKGGQTLKSVEAIARNIEPNALAAAKSELGQSESDLVQIRNKIGKPWPKADEYTRKTARLREIEAELAKKEGDAKPDQQAANEGGPSAPVDKKD